jgi:ABC-2 type transport system permease protein
MNGAADVLVDRAAGRPSLVRNLWSLIAYREMIRNLVLKDLKLKYRGSILGFLWSLVNPVATVGIYTFAFKYVMANAEPGFPFFVLLGVLAWSFFANSAMMSTGALIESSGLVKAVRFPYAVLPLATVLFNLTQYVLTAVVLLPAMFLLYRAPALGPLSVFPIILVLQVALTVGVALMLSAATIFFRDVRHFVDIAISFLFWTTPIVYSIDRVPDSVRPLVLASPMSPFVTAYQAIFYRGVWPDPAVWVGAIAYGVGALAIGIIWFSSVEHRFDEQL